MNALRLHDVARARVYRASHHGAYDLSDLKDISEYQHSLYQPNLD